MGDVCDYEKERLLRIQENQKFLMSLGLDKKLDIPQAPKREWKKKSEIEDEDFVPRRSTRSREPKTNNNKNNNNNNNNNFVEGEDESSEDDEYDEETHKKIDSQISKWKSRNPNPGRRVQGGRIYDSENGTTCHQCRQKTIEPKVQCTNVIEGANGAKVICNVRLDDVCLTNRYGQTIEAALASGEWKCPKCLGICNCSFCRQNGFESVDAYLRNRTSGQQAPIKRTKKSKSRRSEVDVLTDFIPDENAANNLNNDADNNNNNNNENNDTNNTNDNNTKRARKTIATTRERRECTRNKKYENEEEQEEETNNEDDKERVDEEREEEEEEGYQEDEYEVEKILKMKKIRGKKDEYLYLVKWKGYDEETWEPKSNLYCDNILDEFLKNQVKKQKIDNIQIKLESNVKDEATRTETDVKLKKEETIVKSELNTPTKAKRERKEVEIKSEKGINKEDKPKATKKQKKEPTKGILGYFKVEK